MCGGGREWVGGGRVEADNDIMVHLNHNLTTLSCVGLYTHCVYTVASCSIHSSVGNFPPYLETIVMAKSFYPL